MFTPQTSTREYSEDLPAVMGYAELPAWLHDQEEISVSEFRRFTRQPVRSILAMYEDIAQQVVPLRTADPLPDVQPGAAAVLRKILDEFDPQAGLLASPDPDDVSAFYDHAWRVSQRCDSCFAEYSHLLIPVYPDLVLALHTGGAGIRKEVGTLAPAITEFRLLEGRIRKIRTIHAAIQKIDAETRVAMAKETMAAANIHTHQIRLAAIGSALAALDSDPEAFAEQENREFEQLKAERTRLRTTYEQLAVLLTGLTRRAAAHASANRDEEAQQVLDHLTAILEARGVPDGDILFSALINGYPVLLEMIDKGELVPGDEIERYLFMDAGAFTTGMRNLCKDYQATGVKCDQALTAARQHTTPERRREDLLGERRDHELQMRTDSAERDDARALQEVTAMHRQTMARMIEGVLTEMTGRDMRLVLNWPPAEM